MLKFLSEEVGSTQVLKFHGSLDALTVPEVRPSVDALVEKHPARIVVDLANVTTIDSSGVALVVSLFKRMRAAGGTIRVAGVQGQPREIFQFLKLDASLPMAPSVAEALAGM